jgi:hypothetical protein
MSHMRNTTPDRKSKPPGPRGLMALKMLLVTLIAVCAYALLTTLGRQPL